MTKSVLSAAVEGLRSGLGLGSILKTGTERVGRGGKGLESKFQIKLLGHVAWTYIMPPVQIEGKKEA